MHNLQIRAFKGDTHGQAACGRGDGIRVSGTGSVTASPVAAVAAACRCPAGAGSSGRSGDSPMRPKPVIAALMGIAVQWGLDSLRRKEGAQYSIMMPWRCSEDQTADRSTSLTLDRRWEKAAPENGTRPRSADLATKELTECSTRCTILTRGTFRTNMSIHAIASHHLTRGRPRHLTDWRHKPLEHVC